VFFNLCGTPQTKIKSELPSDEPTAIWFEVWWHFQNVSLMMYWKTSWLAAPLSIGNGAAVGGHCVKESELRRRNPGCEGSNRPFDHDFGDLPPHPLVERLSCVAGGQTVFGPSSGVDGDRKHPHHCATHRVHDQVGWSERAHAPSLARHRRWRQHCHSHHFGKFCGNAEVQHNAFDEEGECGSVTS